MMPAFLFYLFYTSFGLLVTYSNNHFDITFIYFKVNFVLYVLGIKGDHQINLLGTKEKIGVSFYYLLECLSYMDDCLK